MLLPDCLFLESSLTPPSIEWRRRLVALGVVVAVGCAAQNGAADERAIVVGAHGGIGLPFGRVAHDSPLGDFISNQPVLGIDVAYRLDRLQVGLYFDYGFANINWATYGEVATPGARGLSVTGSIVHSGVELRYHLFPEGQFHPWLGSGFGYETAFFSGQGEIRDLGGAVYPPVNPLGGGLQGFEWTVLKLGGDLRVTRSVAFGPFAGLSLGQYLTASEAYKDGNYLPPGNIAGKAAHFWLTLGISGAYDFGL